MMKAPQKRKVSLVLGSGGARGLTQIGVIRYIQEMGYEVDEVIGCSIGALIGAAFACGRASELGDWMNKLTKAEVFRLMDFTNSRSGFLKGTRVLKTLQEVFEDVNIEDLPLRYRAIATDLRTEQEVCFESGSIYQAIRASIAVPGVFTGVELEDRFLVDGGVLNPVPVNYVAHKENIIVAVNLEALTEQSIHSISNFRSVSLLQESYYAMRRKLTALYFELYAPDYVIDVPVDFAGMWEFHKSAELIEKGYDLAKTVLATLLINKESLSDKATSLNTRAEIRLEGDVQ